MGVQGGGGRRRQERKGNQTGRVMGGGGRELWRGPQSPTRGGSPRKGTVLEGSTGWVRGTHGQWATGWERFQLAYGKVGS